MELINHPNTEMPEGYDQMTIKPSEEGYFHVINAEKVSMKSFFDLKDAAIWRDHFFFGYYRNCGIVKL